MKQPHRWVMRDPIRVAHLAGHMVTWPDGSHSMGMAIGHNVKSSVRSLLCVDRLGLATVTDGTVESIEQI